MPPRTESTDTTPKTDLTQTRTPSGIPLVHNDHGLSKEHLAVIDLWLNGWDGTFTIRHAKLPDGCPDLSSSLWGPEAGDDPIPESEVKYIRRADRPGPSRVIDRPSRPTRMMVVIAGPTRDGFEPIIYTAFGGFPSPREWWDNSMNPTEAHEAAAFWMEHALCHDVDVGG